MRTFTQNEPLTDAELDRLGDFLKSCKGGKAMNVEQLDGFFAALIAGPEIVMPSEYYVEVFGGEMSDACEFGSLDEANEILGLMMRHWNTIAGTLNKDEVYGPILLQDENGVAHGNDWAHGFMRGTLMRHDGWLELVNDEEQGGCMVPIFMLHYEHEFSLQLSHQMWGLTITLGRRPRERQELIIPPVCLRARNSSWADRPMTVERP
jgi:uncharacterized protein